MGALFLYYYREKGFCGVQRRYPDGSKKCVAGSHLGLMYSWEHVENDSDYIFICEGFSDGISLYDLGLNSIARYNCRHTDGIERFFSDILEGIDHLIIVPDNNTVGMEGAIELRSVLDDVYYGNEEWPCECEIFFFGGAKDIRSYITKVGKQQVKENWRGIYDKT